MSANQHDQTQSNGAEAIEAEKPQHAGWIFASNKPAGQTLYYPTENLRDAERYRAIRARFLAETGGEFSAAEFDAQCDGFAQSEGWDG
ncbi:hypothetical protein [Herminiimonas sp. CN]|uniref:hypothetical protein n=1 Tax=Herminiimonas sp. CN TaxID=1349818 RepID=UPI0004739CC2|nr:hypothetical protein [Herminiimonas sp. CN]